MTPDLFDAYTTARLAWEKKHGKPVTKCFVSKKTADRALAPVKAYFAPSFEVSRGMSTLEGGVDWYVEESAGDGFRFE